jgi:hypothetical protein
MRRFPYISLIMLVAALVATFWVEEVTSTHCAFGFGGFQCNEPYEGWRSALFALGLVLVGASALLVCVAAWQVFRWWRAGRAR